MSENEQNDMDSNEPIEYCMDEITNNEWLRFLSLNSAFDFLNDPEEDIYTLEDGKPFNSDD